MKQKIIFATWRRPFSGQSTPLPVYKDNSFLGQQLHFFAKLDNNFWITAMLMGKTTGQHLIFFETGQQQPEKLLSLYTGRV